LKRVRVFSEVSREGKQELRSADQSNLFVFCEKNTGVAHFKAGSPDAPDYSLDRVASLFAMQCLVRGFNPEDFVVLVPAEKKVVGALVARTKELLDEGRAVSSPTATALSPRQREVLKSVLRNRANKEIASTLNITVRTVKFHISSLLSKFGVENRSELARRAAGLVEPASREDNPMPAVVDETSGDVRRRDGRPLGPRPVGADYRLQNKTSGLGFPGRAITA
jgi:DNA-binding CsgD family transcriptional regulator